jgi:hypothetical protein
MLYSLLFDLNKLDDSSITIYIPIYLSRQPRRSPLTVVTIHACNLLVKKTSSYLGSSLFYY